MKKGKVKGKLIVLDGIDGSGKATQTALLKKRLQKEKVRVKTIDFPRYEKNFFGALIGEALRGDLGDFIGVHPKIASALYAADRFESCKQITQWLEQGYVVLADRYVSANQIHQGGKIDNAKKRNEYLAWLDKMEHTIFGIPRPDLIIYLDVPFEVSREWLQKKVTKRKKGYLKGRKDVAEDNLRYLKNSRNSALYLAKKQRNWRKITCCKGMVCMVPETVHEYVYDIVRKKLQLRK